jgi:hypothetical protein
MGTEHRQRMARKNAEIRLRMEKGELHVLTLEGAAAALREHIIGSVRGGPGEMLKQCASPPPSARFNGKLGVRVSVHPVRQRTGRMEAGLAYRHKMVYTDVANLLFRLAVLRRQVQGLPIQVRLCEQLRHRSGPSRGV